MSSLLVTGSRDWPSQGILSTVLDEFIVGHFDNNEKVTLINGGAYGADLMAVNYWRQNAVGDVITVYPDWNLHGKKAGIIRNVDMLNMDPTYVIAFIYNISKGATFTFNEAKKRGLQVYAFSLDTHKRNQDE